MSATAMLENYLNDLYMPDNSYLASACERAVDASYAYSNIHVNAFSEGNGVLGQGQVAPLFDSFDDLACATRKLDFRIAVAEVFGRLFSIKSEEISMAKEYLSIIRTCLTGIATFADGQVSIMTPEPSMLHGGPNRKNCRSFFADIIRRFSSKTSQPVL